ncbi:MAG: tetratricopeptide repeat protein [Gammaproteobacteria bacterium]
MLAKKFVAALGVVLLAGCSILTEQAADTELVIDETSAIKERPDTISVDDAVLDKDDLYLLLLAEIAGQRGLYEIALEAYLRAAKHISDPQVAERAAKIALYLKDKEKTDTAVAVWLQEDPENLTARKIGALSALRNGDKNEALEHLDFLLKEEADAFENTLLEIVKVLDAEGKSETVYGVLDELSVRHPEEAVIYYVQALLAMQMKHPDQALKKVRKALVLHPGWTKALMFRAQLAAYTGELGVAKNILRKALQNEPRNLQIKKLLAQVLIKSEDYNGAADVLKSLIKQRQQDSESKYQLALVYLQLRRPEKARPLLEELVADPSWSNQASLYLGRIEAQRGNTSKALVWFDKVSDGPLALESAMSGVSLLVSEGRVEEALSRLNTMRVRFPKQEIRLVLLEAEIYTRQKRFEQAFEVLTRALTTQPKQKELLYTRALVAENLNRLDVLEADLKLILEQDPNDVNALNALGYTLADRTNRYSEAKQYLQKAIKLRPNEAVIMDSYGWLQYRLGNLSQAIDYLSRAYKLQKEGEIAAHVVEVLWALGRKQDARRFYNRALKEVSSKQELVDLRQRLKGF